MTVQNQSAGRKRHTIFFRFLFALVFGVILPIAVLACGIYCALYLMRSAPKAERRARSGQSEARLVEVLELKRAEHRVTVEAMGVVKPARIVRLQPQVGGAVIATHPALELGGHFPAGETLLTIDPRDYELAAGQRRAQVAQMQSNLKIEMGQQEIARQEFEILGAEIPADEQSLVLRKPQLERAQADLDAAQTALEMARLDLQRTEIKAPFNCVVLEENVELGATVTPQTVLAELAGTDQFWVELALPVDEIRWIELPQSAAARIHDEAAWGPLPCRAGHVLRLTGNLDPQSRMAILIATVDDPLSLRDESRDEPRLLLNSYVRAEIDGRVLADVIAIPREYVREGDTTWVMDEQNRLAIRPLEIVWRGFDHVLVGAGVEDGERLVISNLTAPVAGMSLRTSSAADQLRQAGEQTAEGESVMDGGSSENARGADAADVKRQLERPDKADAKQMNGLQPSPAAQPGAAVPHSAEAIAQPGAAVPHSAEAIAQPGAAVPHSAEAAAQPGAAVPHSAEAIAQPGAAVLHTN